MKSIVCSHGFGVDATDRGLFTDIAAAFPDADFRMFDYNTKDAAGNMTVRPLGDQVAQLKTELNKTTGGVTLLCHSQGCIVASMLPDFSKVERMIFLTPPQDFDIERFSRIFGDRPGAVFNRDGASSFPRRDGTTTYIGKDYLDSIESIDVLGLYAKAATARPVTIVRASDDEIAGDTDFTSVGATVLTLPSGHDFSGEARTGLIETLKPLI